MLLVAVVWWCGGGMLRLWPFALGPEVDGRHYILASLVFICVNYLLLVSIWDQLYLDLMGDIPLVYSYEAYECSCAVQYVPHWYQYSESQ